MKRSSRLIDFTLVTFSVTTILLSLLPLALSQQSPVEQLVPESTGLELMAAAPELPPIDPKIAVTRWQQEAADFYAHRDTAKSPFESQSPVQIVGFHDPITSEALGEGPITANAHSTANTTAKTSAKTSAKTPLGVVFQHRRFQERGIPMPFLFAICGGVLLGLGYLEWSRRTPAQLPGGIEFYSDDDTVATVELDAKWATVSQSSAVKLRRATLGGLVVAAFATLVV